MGKSEIRNTVRCKAGRNCSNVNVIMNPYPAGIVVNWPARRWNRMPKTEKQVAPSAWAWIGGALIAAALLAAVIAGYFYFFHTAK